MGKSDTATKSKKVKKVKKKREGPKRPASAFILFSKVERPKLKAAHPDWSFGEYGKELGKRWGKLSDSAKKPYLDENAKRKKEYAKAKAAWDKSHPKK